MRWQQLNSLNDLDNLVLLSEKQNVLIFKHSTRCITSRYALRDFESGWKEGDEEKIIPYLLDLLSHRDISNEIEKRFGVAHQSPQALLIRNGKSFYSVTHSEIDYREIMEKVR